MTSPEAPKTRRKTDRLLGRVFAGKYKILKKIGEGGMGSVYLANQDPIDRRVAVKVLLGKLVEDDVSVRRFEQEARAISKMQHPNTVTIYDFGRTDDEDGQERLYIVMEYLKGRTLTDVLRAESQLVGARASRIVRQVCASLADAHAAGIIHRDLKPDNIFLTEVGTDKDWVKVLDFGVAKLANSESAGTLTQTGMIFGTPKYMSPEQAEGRQLDFRADIYALGVILFELLTGRPPFVADTPVGLLLKHISETPPTFEQLRPDLQVDPRLESIVRKALAKAPDDRFQAVGDLAAELENYERTVSGGYVLATGTVPTPMSPGLPTEVMGSSEGMTPGDLRSPDSVPPNLSDGISAPTAGSATAPAHTDATRVASPDDPRVATVQARAEGGGRSAGLAFGLLALVGAGAAAAFVLVSGDTSPEVRSIELPSAPAAAEAPEITEEAAARDDPPSEDAPPPSASKGAPAAPAPAQPAVRSRGKPPAAEPQRARIMFDSEPRDAVVFIGREQIGITPFTFPFEAGREVSVVFKKPGYEPTRRKLVVRRGTRVAVQLSKRTKPLPPPPKPDPKPGAEKKVSDLK